VQTVDIHEALDNTLLILNGRLGDGVQIRRDYGPNVPPIQAYGRELNQVWTNLLDNAVTALEGQGTITIRTACLGERDGWIRIEIEDDGPGIAPHIQSVLFEPFVTTKKPGQGTGLGLNICYNVIVDKQKGEITFDSRPGRTVFTIRLPVNFETT
jgi:signal transduction histidine kinase